MDYLAKEKVKRHLEMYFKGKDNGAENELEGITSNGKEFLEVAKNYIEDLRDSLEEELEEKEKEHKTLIEKLQEELNEFKEECKDNIDLKDPKIKIGIEHDLREYFIHRKNLPFNYPESLNKYMNGMDLIEILYRAKEDAATISKIKPPRS